MSKKLSVGDYVICRFYNTPNRKFYGPSFTARIVNIDLEADLYGVQETSGSKSNHWMHRKEILRRIEKPVTVTLVMNGNKGHLA